MPQIIKCPHCSKPLQVADDSAGKQVRCPNQGCAKVFTASVAPAREAALVGAATPSRSPADASVSIPLPGLASTKRAADKPASGKNLCPACKAELLPGAISCMDCGYMAAPDTGGAPDDDVLVCANPQCGAANPKGEKNCIRCCQILPPPPGTIVHNRYRIEKQLAVGGFGAVYLATDTKTTKPVAIKDMICEDPGEIGRAHV